MEDQFHAERSEHPGHEVELAHGHAAGEDQHVLFREQLPQFPLQHRAVVGQMATHAVREAALHECRRERTIVRGPDLRGRERLADLDEFVTR